MKYLVACDHARQIIDRPSWIDARGQFTCKKCVKFDLENERWVYDDIRVYLAQPGDELALAPGTVDVTASRKNLAKLKADNLDWVNLEAEKDK